MTLKATQVRPGVAVGAFIVVALFAVILSYEVTIPDFLRAKPSWASLVGAFATLAYLSFMCSIISKAIIFNGKNVAWIVLFFFLYLITFGSGVRTVMESIAQEYADVKNVFFGDAVTIVSMLRAVFLAITFYGINKTYPAKIEVTVRDNDR